MRRCEKLLDRRDQRQPGLRACRGTRRLARRHADQQYRQFGRHGGDRHVAFQSGKTQVHALFYPSDKLNSDLGFLPKSLEGSVKQVKTSA